MARVAQRVGLSVKDIREIRDDLGDDPTLEDRARVHHALTTEAHRRIDELNAALAAIASGEKLCEL